MTRADASIGARMTLERGELERASHTSQRHWPIRALSGGARERFSLVDRRARDSPPACRLGTDRDSAAGELLLTLAAAGAAGRGQGISSVCQRVLQNRTSRFKTPCESKFVPNQWAATDVVVVLLQQALGKGGGIRVSLAAACSFVCARCKSLALDRAQVSDAFESCLACLAPEAVRAPSIDRNGSLK